MTDPDVPVIGVRMGAVFEIAKAHAGLSLADVDALLDRDEYEVRMVAVALLDFKARDRRIDDAGRRELYEMWMSRLDRMDIWDLIDRSAPRVLGVYLVDKSRDPLSRSPGRPFAGIGAPPSWPASRSSARARSMTRCGCVPCSPGTGRPPPTIAPAAATSANRRFPSPSRWEMPCAV